MSAKRKSKRASLKAPLGATRAHVASFSLDAAQDVACIVVLLLALVTVKKLAICLFGDEAHWAAFALELLHEIAVICSGVAIVIRRLVSFFDLRP